MRKTGCDIVILEKTGKLLSKVRISGGGRCNVTNACFDNSELVKNYPRGHKELRQVFSQFSVKETLDWFRSQGVTIKTEPDGRMFPYSDSSETIINCFLRLASDYNISIVTNCEVRSIQKKAEGFDLNTSIGKLEGTSVICALGGHPKTGAYDLIRSLGHQIDEPIPSLFTINLPTELIKKELQGISVNNAEVRIPGSKLSYNGPVLVTHWGLSGPAVLKLSAFAAEEFFKRNYVSEIIVNWVFPMNMAEVEREIKQFQRDKHKSLPWSSPLFGLPRRLWEYLCLLADIRNDRPWAEIGNKQITKLATLIQSSSYNMQGKTTFKEEFVTCGGVNLKEINFKTMQSKLVPGLFFCGEVMNIDGITGGFNFQNAWSTAWVCAQNAC